MSSPVPPKPAANPADEPGGLRRPAVSESRSSRATWLGLLVIVLIWQVLAWLLNQPILPSPLQVAADLLVRGHPAATCWPILAPACGG